VEVLLTLVVAVVCIAYEFVTLPSKKRRDEKLIRDARRVMKSHHATSRRAGRKIVEEAVRSKEISDAEASVKRSAQPRRAGTTEEWESIADKPVSVSDASKSAGPVNPELSALLSRCTRMDELIDSRFEATELTAVRYRLVLDEVRLGMLSNLDRQRRLRASVSHLDRATIEQDLAGELDDSRNRILRERLALLDDVENRISRMQVANDQALHTLDRAIVVLTDLAAKDGRTNSGLQGSVADLESLVSRAHRTSSGAGEFDDIEIKPSSQTRKSKRKKTIKPGSS